jgi:HAD superfamily hydrolase (TIGR01509 family)
MEAESARGTKAPFKIRAIVFDLGGVLFSEGKRVALERLSKHYAYRQDLVSKILLSSQSLDLRRGLLTDEQFWSWAQRQLPSGYDAEVIKREWYGGYLLDEDILGLIKKLKEKYRLVAFSGNIKSRIAFLEKKYAFRELFDVEIYSFDHHLTKPDRKFTAIMVRECGCRPEEIIYIDDNEKYVWPAQELGVQVLIYSRGDVAKLKRQLRALGVLLNKNFTRI